MGTSGPLHLLVGLNTHPFSTPLGALGSGPEGQHQWAPSPFSFQMVWTSWEMVAGGERVEHSEARTSVPPSPGCSLVVGHVPVAGPQLSSALPLLPGLSLQRAHNDSGRRRGPGEKALCALLRRSEWDREPFLRRGRTCSYFCSRKTPWHLRGLTAEGLVWRQTVVWESLAI